jgi:UV DNA damage endonuclease
LPVCIETGVPMVYDVHHHRCLPDGLSVAEATEQTMSTWNREPLFHLSSPSSAWGTGPCRPHHDFIDLEDFPCEWRDLKATIEIEAKAKEMAVGKLAEELPAHLIRRCKAPRKKRP